MAGTYESAFNWDLTETSELSELSEKMAEAAEMNLGAPFALVEMAWVDLAEKARSEGADADELDNLAESRAMFYEALQIVINRVNSDK